MGRTLSGLVGFLLALGAGVGSCVDRPAADEALLVGADGQRAQAPRVFDQVGVLPDVLAETSGLAISRTQAGVLWTHNDSGDGPNLYAIDDKGRLLAIVPVSGATARDWEDIALGPCPPTLPPAPLEEGEAAPATATVRAACLYLADTGDNDRVRDSLTVYVVREPPVVPGIVKAPGVSAGAFRYSYPHEPEDTEALAVTPDGDVTIVTKGRTGSIDFFGVAAAALSDALVSGQVVKAVYQGNTGIAPNQSIGRHVTGAAVSPDGMTLAVRTYTEVYFFGAVTPGPDGRRWRDLARPCLLGTAEPQGEGIDYLDDKTLLVTSEAAPGVPAALRRLQCE